jgi:hypothetical protein
VPAARLAPRHGRLQNFDRRRRRAGADVCEGWVLAAACIGASDGAACGPRNPARAIPRRPALLIAESGADGQRCRRRGLPIYVALPACTSSHGARAALASGRRRSRGRAGPDDPDRGKAVASPGGRSGPPRTSPRAAAGSECGLMVRSWVSSWSTISSVATSIVLACAALAPGPTGPASAPTCKDAMLRRISPASLALAHPRT